MMKAEAAKIGVKVLGASQFSDTALTATPEFQQAMATHPDVIWETDEGQSSTVLKGRLAAGATSIPFICDNGCAANGQLKSLDGPASLANGWTLSWPIVVAPVAKRTPQEAQFVKAITAVGGPRNYVTSGLAYDALMLVGAGARQANSVDPEKIEAALNHLSPSNASWGIGWPYEFSSTDHGGEPPTANSPYVGVPLDNNLSEGDAR
jgi:ABC-type branched-subunit amino acid transport system substrate-binding protein